jgi:hypothetical protein
MHKYAVAAATTLALLGVAACGSKNGTKTTTTKTTSGTEVITATSADPNATSVTVHASGVYAGDGMFVLPQTTKATTVHFVFPAGTLTADASASKGETIQNKATCVATQDSTGTYTVTTSTGVFKDATGHGQFSAEFKGTTAMKAGACENPNASGVTPLKGTWTLHLRVAGPLTLHHVS